MDRILLTGYSGFTGSFILELAARKKIRIFCLSEDGKASSAPIDLLDYRAVNEKIREINPTSLIHLAALSHVQHEPAADFYGINVGGSRNLVQAMASLDSGLVNCVFASSANVYGNSHEIVLHENDPLSPVNDYGLSKKGMEEMLYLWRYRLPITITRPFNYTGLGQKNEFLIPKIVSAFKARQTELELGNLTVSRDFSDVRFIDQAYLTLACQTSEFRILNLCSGTLTSINEIISLCSQITGHHLNVISKPEFIRKNEILKLKGATENMERALGYKSGYTLRDTLSWMLLNNFSSSKNL